MLDRVEMDVVNVLRHIRLITQCVFPVAPLPYREATVRPLSKHHALLSHSVGKARFDGRPACRVVAVGFGQGPDRVQMLGQHDDGVHIERQACFGTADCVPEQGNVIGQGGGGPIRQCQREKVACAFHPIATVLHHGSS